jgi:ATP-binding cassette subfamily B protein
MVTRSQTYLENKSLVCHMADRIIVIKQGKIIEDGTHEALMAIDGTYAHLFRLQAAGYVIS